MVFGITGTLELASLVPSSWRLSTSLVLQTSALVLLVYAVFKIVNFILRSRRLQKEFGDYPGPKEAHWLFGSFHCVSISCRLPCYYNLIANLICVFGIVYWFECVFSSFLIMFLFFGLMIFNFFYFKAKLFHHKR